MKFSRLDIILKELDAFVLLKTFITSKNQEFALYIFTKNLLKVINFCNVTEFKNELAKHTQFIKNSIHKDNTELDLTEIYQEG